MKISTRRIVRLLCIVLMLAVMATLVVVTMPSSASGNGNKIDLSYRNVVGYSVTNSEVSGNNVVSEAFKSDTSASSAQRMFDGDTETGVSQIYYIIDLGKTYDLSQVSVNYSVTNYMFSSAEPIALALFASNEVNRLPANVNTYDDWETLRSIESGTESNPSWTPGDTIGLVGSKIATSNTSGSTWTVKNGLSGVRYLGILSTNMKMPILELTVQAKNETDVEDFVIPVNQGNVDSANIGTTNAGKMIDGKISTYTSCSTAAEIVYDLCDEVTLKGFGAIFGTWTSATSFDTYADIDIYVSKDGVNFGSPVYHWDVESKYGDYGSYFSDAQCMFSKSYTGVRYVKLVGSGSTPVTYACENKIDPETGKPFRSRSKTVNTVVSELWFIGKVTGNVPSYEITVDDTLGNTASATLKKGQRLSAILPEIDPVKEGEEFAGWYNGDTLVTATTKVSGTMNIKAKFMYIVPLEGANAIQIDTPNNASKLFDGNEGSLYGGTDHYIIIDIGKNYNAQAGNTFVFNAILQKVGASDLYFEYSTTQSNWKTGLKVPANSEAGKYGFSTTKTIRYIRLRQELTTSSAYASWGLKEIKCLSTQKTGAAVKWYTISYDSNGGSAVATQRVQYGDTSYIVASPMKSGYEFGGWYRERAFKTPFTGGVIIERNITVYARWIKEGSGNSGVSAQYNIVFDSNGGAFSGSKTQDTRTVAANKKLATSNFPANPTRKGYNFLGWYTDANNYTSATAYSRYTIVVRSMTVYARWAKIACADAEIPIKESNYVTKKQDDGNDNQGTWFPSMFDGTAATYSAGYNGTTSVLLDLGSVYKISHLQMVLDNNKSVKIYTGVETRELRLVYDGGSEKAYATNTMDVDTSFSGRYIKVVRGATTSLNEIKFYGFKVPVSGYSVNPITNIRASWNKSNESDPYVQLNWTDTGVDCKGYGNNLFADDYEIRYSKTPISESNWSSATLLTDDDYIEADFNKANITPPSCGRRGKVQQCAIYNLDELTGYYFAIKPYCKWGGNTVYAPLSNVAFFSTPADTVAPGTPEKVTTKLTETATDDTTQIAGGSAIAFSLTSSGDNGSRGTACQYRVYYSENPFSAFDNEGYVDSNNGYQQWLSNASENRGTSALFASRSGFRFNSTANTTIYEPEISGTYQKQRVNGMKPLTTYYLALVAFDKHGNKSELVLIDNGEGITTGTKDTTKPGKITDLDATYKQGTVTMTFTAPGSDGYSSHFGNGYERSGYIPFGFNEDKNNANCYEYQVRILRGSVSSITLPEGAWGSATVIDERSYVPAKAGTTENLTFDIESEADMGYFYAIAIKAVDVDGNISEISNGDMYAIGKKVKLCQDNKYECVSTLIESFPNIWDEQDCADPGNPFADEVLQYAPEKSMHETWSHLTQSAWDGAVFLDLRADYYVTEIYGYWSSGNGTAFDVYLGTPFSSSWNAENAVVVNKKFTDANGGAGSGNWCSIVCNGESRYVRIQPNDLYVGWGLCSEVMVYGIQLSERKPLDNYFTTDVKTTTLDQMLGTNTFVNAHLDDMALFENTREYRNWRWDAGNLWDTWPDAYYAFNPSNAGGGTYSVWKDGWFSDDWNDKVSKICGHLMTCWQQNVYGGGWHDDDATDDRKWMSDAVAHMCRYGSDMEDPNSYIEHADFFYQAAARYGRTVIDDSLITVASNQTKKTALGTVDCLENGNENDSSWRGRYSYYTPFQMAAMGSADCDGHCGTMSYTASDGTVHKVGTKIADPTMQFAMFGTANGSVNYHRAVQFWSYWNRPDSSYPADYINWHQYFNSNGYEQNFSSTQSTGTVLEQWSLMYDDGWGALKNMYDLDAHYIHNVKLYVGECGYDINKGSKVGCMPYGSFTSEQMQSYRLCRLMMWLDFWNIEYAAQYMINCTSGLGEGGQYATSGVTTRVEDGQDKEYIQSRLTSWNGLYCMKNALTGYHATKSSMTNTVGSAGKTSANVFTGYYYLDADGNRVYNDPNIIVMEFAGTDGTHAYGAWTKKEDDVKYGDVYIPVDSSIRVYTKTEQDGTSIGTRSECFVNKEGYVVSQWVSAVPVYFTQGYMDEWVQPTWSDNAKVDIEVLDEIADNYKSSLDDLVTVRLTWTKPYSTSDLDTYTIYVGDHKWDSIPVAYGETYDLTIGVSEYADISIDAQDIHGQNSVEKIESAGPVDIQAPSKARNPETFGINENEVSFKFDAASDNREEQGNLSYNLYCNDKKVAHNSQTFLTATKLKKNTEYKFYITSVDAAGNESSPTKTVVVSTAAGNFWATILLIVLIVLILAAAGFAVYLFIQRQNRIKQAKALFATEEEIAAQEAAAAEAAAKAAAADAAAAQVNGEESLAEDGMVDNPTEAPPTDEPETPGESNDEELK